MEETGQSGEKRQPWTGDHYPALFQSHSDNKRKHFKFCCNKPAILIRYLYHKKQTESKKCRKINNRCDGMIRLKEQSGFGLHYLPNSLCTISNDQYDICVKNNKHTYISHKVADQLVATQSDQCLCCSITKTRPCNILQYFTAVKMTIFS